MFKSSNNYEIVKGLTERMSGLILGATPKHSADFNVASQDIWLEIMGEVCGSNVSVAAKFSRTRRPSDHHTLPPDQAATSLFVDYQDPAKKIEVDAGKLLEVVTAPAIEDDKFVFSLTFPDAPQATLVRWPLMHSRPTFDIICQADLE